MRSVLPLVLVGLALGACQSDFRSRYRLPQDCERRLYFFDEDGDGWGAPESEAVELCEADTVNQLTARNNLDCDDTNADTTGLVGSICPADLVVGGAAYIGVKASGAEYVAVIPADNFANVADSTTPTTALVFAQGAAGACGATGWGGGLATFDNLTELTELTDAIDDVAPNGAWYAAWVGLVPASDGSDWVWEGQGVGEGLNPTEVGWCNANARPDAGDDRDPGRHVALVRQDDGSWCFGIPSDANPEVLDEGDLSYTARDAHSICARPTPQASEFTVDRLPTE